MAAVMAKTRDGDGQEGAVKASKQVRVRKTPVKQAQPGKDAKPAKAGLRRAHRSRGFLLISIFAEQLAHAWRWTAAMPWRDRAAVDGYLAATYALVDSTDAERTGVRLKLP